MSLRENIRHKFFDFSPLVRLLLIGILLISVCALVWSLTGRVSGWARGQLFSRTEAHLIDEANAAIEKARLAEGRAKMAEALLIQKDKELSAANARAEAAENALSAARNVTVRFKQDYDKSRNIDLSAIAPDAQRLCSELYTLGFACRPRL
jgi:hypothetical protein